MILVKPMTYMNRSGEPLGAIGQFYKIEPPEILIVLDDLALPLGRLRLRARGGAGGHNGPEHGQIAGVRHTLASHGCCSNGKPVGR